MKRQWSLIFLILCIVGSPLAFSWAQEYQIGPEDVIEVVVWKEPDVSRTILVRPDGRISLPLLGDVQAKGLTPEELATNLEKALEKFIQTPNVSVIVEQINSRKVYVLGRVNSPGVFPLRSEMTLLQAIALAGGFSEWAKKGDIILLRRTDGIRQRFVINLKKVIEGKKSSEDIRLQPGDKIIVP